MLSTRELSNAINAKLWFQENIVFFLRPAEIIRQYQPTNLRADFIAGLTVAVVMLPQAIAYALIAELPAEVGLYSAIVAAIVGALWGSSFHLHTGPTNAASLLVLSTLLPVVSAGTSEYIAAAALMAVIVGVTRLLMGLAHLGVLVNFVSDSVIIGFTAGAGILISANQLRHLLHLPIESTPRFVETVIAIANNLSATHVPTLLLGIITIVTILLIRRVKPSWPATFIGMVTTSLLVGLFHLDQYDVIVLGELPRNLPPFAVPPLFNLALLEQVAIGSFAVSMIGLAEATSITRSIAARTGQQLDSNQEFVGQGLANIAVGFFSGYPCSGSFARSSVNHNAGARTPLAAVFSSIFAMLALLLFAPYAAYLPRTALAGVLMVTAYRMVDRKEMRRIWNASSGDSSIMVATLLATLFLPLQFAVLAGIIVSIVRFLVKTSTPRVNSVVPTKDFLSFQRVRQHPVCPQLGIVEISGSLYFGAAQHVEKTIRRNLTKHPEQQFLMLRMHLVDHCDVSGIHMLESVVRIYRQRNGDVFISGARGLLREQMRTFGFEQYLGRNHFQTRPESISHLFHRVLEPSVCIYECEARVFAECQALPKQLYNEPQTGIQNVPEHDLESLYPNELRAHIENRFLILVDVREPAEFRKGHIPDAQSIPLRLVRQRGLELPTDRPIIIVCRIGRRSRLGANILKDMGYKRVYNLEGGTLAWEAAGYPLVITR
ncbi:SulP family inorganic anion transporter [Anaerolineales bacterium HSG6]|nr:SulP family inorganic anion transporter [Anaerolineales bacterium HSG6]